MFTRTGLVPRDPYPRPWGGFQGQEPWAPLACSSVERQPRALSPDSCRDPLRVAGPPPRPPPACLLPTCPCHKSIPTPNGTSLPLGHPTCPSLLCSAKSLYKPLRNKAPGLSSKILQEAHGNSPAVGGNHINRQRTLKWHQQTCQSERRLAQGSLGAQGCWRPTA